MKLSDHVATNVHNAVYGAGHNASALAKELGVSRQLVSQKMSGQVAFSINDLGEIADWLNVPVYELLQEAEEEVQVAA